MIRKEAMAGVRVCDLSWILAGPTATRYMAAFGAEVIKFEYSQTLDTLRMGAATGQAGYHNPGFTPSVNKPGMYNFWNTNKYGCSLNARHPKGSEILKRVIKISDIVVENYAADVFAAWGFGYDVLREINPSIIYLQMNGFGSEGTGRDWNYTTWGPTAAANSSLTFMSGLPGLPAAGYGYSYMDHTAGYYGFIAALAALHYRNRTGKGQLINLSQVEAGIVLTASTLPDYVVNGRKYRRPDYPNGNRSLYPAVAPYNTYRCLPKPLPTVPPADDRWVTISCMTEEDWQALCRVMGNPEWTKDPKFADMYRRKQNEDELDRHVESWTKTQKAEDVMWACQKAGVASAVVYDPEDRFNDPQYTGRGFYQQLIHPEFGANFFDGVAVHMSKTDWVPLKKTAPLVGEWNDQFYLEYLGLSEEEYEQLKAEGVIQDMGFQKYRKEG